MTLFEWCLAVLLIGPILSAAAAWFLHPSQGYKVGAALLTLSGLGGIAVALMGAVAKAPYSLPTQAFYTMTAAMDKFSAIFLLPAALILLFAGKMAWMKARHSTDHDSMLHASLALLTIGITWALISGNIPGMAAALWIFAAGKAIAIARVHRNTEGKSFIRLIAPAFLGALAITAGLFVASSGALFSDFSTLAYISAEIDFTHLALSFGLIAIGVAALTDAFGCSSAKKETHPLPTPNQALISVGEMVIPLYILARSLLFIYPPLLLWHALVIAAVALIGLVITAWKHATDRSVTMFALLMLAGAMTFQSLALYEVMNTSLFAALITIVGGGISIMGTAVQSQTGRNDARESSARTLLTLAACGLVPSTLFVAVWMLSTALIEQSRAVPFWVAVGFAAALGVVIFSLWRTVRHSAGKARIILATSLHETGSPHERLMIIAVAVISVIAPFLIPGALVAIGAEPMTSGTGTWLSSVIVGDISLRIFVLAVLSIGAAVFTRIFRVQEIGSELMLTDEVTEAHIPEAITTRWSALCLSVQRLAKRYAVMPTHSGIIRVRTWADHHAHATTYIAIIAMVVTAVLTLIIAL